MKVICAGFSKTGTKSMHVALEKLGYGPVYDYPDGVKQCETLVKFTKTGWTIDDIRETYWEYESAVDNSSFYLWEELLEAYPEAKVVLTVRDDDLIWYKSMKRQVDYLRGPHNYWYTLFGGEKWKAFNDYLDYPCKREQKAKYR